MVLNPKISCYVRANIPEPEKLQNPTYFCSQEFICGTLNLHEQIRKPRIKNDGKTNHRGFPATVSMDPTVPELWAQERKALLNGLAGHKTGSSSMFETVYSQASYVFRKMPRKLQKIFLVLSKNL